MSFWCSVYYFGASFFQSFHPLSFRICSPGSMPMPAVGKCDGRKLPAACCCSSISDGSSYRVFLSVLSQLHFPSPKSAIKNFLAFKYPTVPFRSVAFDI